jgi:hypothetical protein
VDSDHIEALRKHWGGPMSKEEIEYLRDTQAFIEFAIRNGLSFSLAVVNVGHDINGLQRYGFDLKAANADGFLPKVTGYSQIDADSVGQTEEPVESTS